ncbi:hypothetical protein BK120_34000 [Paenibacillus sp. FSL A5-0031]|nr:hypothetical protein BK120_34000 [Paenibacillus sp. FSL A5-0031]
MSSNLSVKEQIISKALVDDNFKNELLTNPKAAMKQSFDIEFPESLEINVVSETSRKIFLVIPPKPTELNVNGEPVNAAAWP